MIDANHRSCTIRTFFRVLGPSLLATGSLGSRLIRSAMTPSHRYRRKPADEHQFLTPTDKMVEHCAVDGRTPRVALGLDALAPPRLELDGVDQLGHAEPGLPNR